MFRQSRRVNTLTQHCYFYRHSIRAAPVQSWTAIGGIPSSSIASRHCSLYCML
ncbi:hypothetical protein D6D26_10162 [Aureobasidium pullulans]|nr:hypothetical protein D6D26_10162 [Aureobasidium pullulans]